MADDRLNPAASPHKREWADKARETKSAFNRAALGGRPADKQPDKAQAVHDNEPSLAEKKEGAARNAADSHKPRSRPVRSRPARGRSGPGLER